LEPPAPPGIERFEMLQGPGFYSLLFLAQALTRQSKTDPVQIAVLTNGVQEVNGEAGLQPEKATILGPCKVIPQEYPNLVCRSIDFVLPGFDDWQHERLVDHLIVEVAAQPAETVVAYRGGSRWLQAFKPIRLERATGAARLRERGVYLIAGGSGGLLQIIAR